MVSFLTNNYKDLIDTVTMGVQYPMSRVMSEKRLDSGISIKQKQIEEIERNYQTYIIILYNYILRLPIE